MYRIILTILLSIIVSGCGTASPQRLSSNNSQHQSKQPPKDFCYHVDSSTKQLADKKFNDAYELKRRLAMNSLNNEPVSKEQAAQYRSLELESAKLGNPKALSYFCALNANNHLSTEQHIQGYAYCLLAKDAYRENNPNILQLNNRRIADFEHMLNDEQIIKGRSLYDQSKSEMLCD